MSDPRGDDDAAGCAGCAIGVFLLGLLVAAVVSLAALVDPFSWLPPVGEVWAECDDDFGTDRNECALENRFPGFWLHAVLNLLYATVALGLGVGFAASVADLREKRAARFSSAAAAVEHRGARDLCAGCGAVLAAVALLPIAVAIA